MSGSFDAARRAEQERQRDVDAKAAQADVNAKALALAALAEREPIEREKEKQRVLEETPVNVQCMLKYDAQGNWNDGQFFVNGLRVLWVKHHYPTPGAALDAALQLAGTRALRGG